MKHYIIISVLLGGFFIGAKAQKSETTEHEGKHYGIENHAHWKKVKSADNLVLQHSYYNAIDIYKVVEKDIPDNEYIQHQLANAYFVARDYANAEKYFLRANGHPKHSEKYPMDRFKYGETLKMNGKYDEAIVQFNLFISEGRKARTGEMKYWQKVASNEVNSCEYAKSVTNGDSTFHNVNFIEGDLNHAYTDFSPYPLGKDQLYFASLRQDTVLGYNKKEDVYYPVKTYASNRVGGEWSEPKELPVPFNHEFEHTANIILSEGGNRAYFTRCYPDRHNKVVCNIFYADKDTASGQWQHAHKAGGGVNMSGFTSTQPTVQRLEKKKRRTSESYDVLYFVSDRPNGEGGKDIWYTEVRDTKFSTPVNCGKRINTMRDEVTPTYDPIAGKMYFSSNFHWGLGGFDAFVSTGKENRFSKPENLGMPTNSSYDDTYYVPVTAKKDSLDYGYLVSNRPGGIALTSETCCDDIYDYQEYLPEFMQLSGKVIQLLASDTSTADSSLTPTPQVKTIKDVRVGYVRKKSVEQVKNEGLQPTTANLQEYIVWVDNTKEDGQFSGQLLKDKSYALVVEKDGLETRFVDMDSVTKAKQGDLSGIEIAMKELVVKVDSSKIEKPKTIAFQEREKLSLDVNVSDLKKDEKLVLENMYFDTNQDKIKETSKASLELLLAFMKKNEGIKIEISGHTDSRGNDDYNLDLSQRRAENVMDYLLKHGIDENRVVAKGYGETEPIAPNQNKDGSDNPEGRKLNRRTEIKILANKK